MIIAIDGLDGSGKESLTKTIKAKLEEDYGYSEDKVLVHSFPCYSNDSGKQIKQVLSGDGFNIPPGDLKAFMVASMFAFNRAEYVSDMKTIYGNDVFKAESMIHIFDRYWGSNVLYQGLGKSGEDLKSFIRLMRSLDTALENPMPDRYYFLRHPYVVLRKRIDSRKSKSVEKDTYEMDTFLKSVYHLSEYMLETMRPPMNPIYNMIIEGSIQVNSFPIQPTYMEKTLGELVNEVLEDLKSNGLLGGEL